MIYQIFQQALKANPNGLAIVDSHGKQWTYDKAAQRIQQWAAFLVSAGIKTNDRVMVLLNDEDHHVFIYLALDRVNAIYVPLDTAHGAQAFAEDCLSLNPDRVIFDGTLGDDYAIPASLQLRLNTDIVRAMDDAPAPLTVPYHANGLEKTSYIVSSSGTTGQKKWIPILGQGLIYWAEVLRDQMKLSASDKVLATRSPAYDARIFEYVEAFASGSALYLLEKNERKDFDYILTVCEKEGITSLLFIASQLNAHKSHALIQQLHKLGVKHLMVTGDTCTPELKALCEAFEISLWNGYGPTEATFGLSILRVNGLALHTDGEQQIVPIGKPWGPDVHYRIINQTLHIQSPYLTPGYLQPEENTAVFRDIDATRWFDTKDVFSERDGFLFYQGRSQSDDFCKISGVKITPHAIEQCLNDYNRVNPLAHVQAAVVIKSYMGQLKPFAYVVITPDLDKEAFQRYLSTRLKKEAIPFLIALDQLPRMPTSDKIDRQALQKRTDDLDAWFEDKTPQQNPTIHTIKAIWQRVLKRDNIPNDTAFLWLGGDSLRAMEMVGLIREQIDPTYSYQRLLRLQTITLQTIASDLMQDPTSEYLSSNQAAIRPLVIHPKASEKDIVFFVPDILGEGYFANLELAAHLSRHVEHSVYGLSDPSIHDSHHLPTDIHHAVQRYIAAIKTIQPEGPYSLLGFSFGGTLAYYVAEQLVQNGENIKELHLVDSFPPMLYQALSASAHLTFLKPLLNFLSQTFNNPFYGEQVQAPKLLETQASITPSQQVTWAFSKLRNQLKNPASICALNLVERHLSFMQNAPLPEKKLSIWPTVYFTKREQAYLHIINQVGLSRDTADYRYFAWNQYVTNLTRSGIELDCEHLGVLHAYHRQPHQSSPSEYWARAHDKLFYLKADYYGPTPFFRVSHHEATHDFTLFFLNEPLQRAFTNRLTKLNLTPSLFFYEKHTEKYKPKDKILNEISTLFFTIPQDKLDAVYGLLAQFHINPKEVARAISPMPLAPSPPKRPTRVDLHLLSGLSSAMQLTFQLNAAPEAITQALQMQLACSVMRETPHQLIYFHSLDSLETNFSLFQQLDQAGEFIADFISVLYGSQPLIQNRHAHHPFTALKSEQPTALCLLRTKPLIRIPVANKPLQQGGTIEYLSQDEFACRFGFHYEEKIEIDPTHRRWASIPESITGELSSTQLKAQLTHLLEHPQENLVLCEINPSIGLGVFASNHIPKDTVLCFYSGLLSSEMKATRHDQAQAYWGLEAAVSTQHHRGISSFFKHLPSTPKIPDISLFLRILKNCGQTVSEHDLRLEDELYSIQFSNPQTRLNLATENVRKEYINYNGVPIILLVTNQAIRAGEQLGLKFGKDYWLSRNAVPDLFDKTGRTLLHAEYKRLYCQLTFDECTYTGDLNPILAQIKRGGTCIQFKDDKHHTRQIDAPRVINELIRVHAMTEDERPSATHNNLRLFKREPMDALLKKYKLPDDSQRSIEKGLRNAAANNQVDDLKWFLSKIQNINAVDDNPTQQKSALHQAANKGFQSCCALLLAHGANPDLKDAKGKSALDYLPSLSGISLKHG